MKNKTNIAKRFHTAIRTQQVFAKNEQVFLKKDTQETYVTETKVAEWFPTDFKWIPVQS